MDYVLHILIMAGIYQILALSLDLLAGQTGILSVAQAAFYALGAYSSALLTVYLGVPFIAGVLAGITIAALASLLVSLPALRMYDDYLVIATFAFQMVLVNILQNWMKLTNGSMGISGIPHLSWFSWLNPSSTLLILTLVFVALALFIVNRISTSPLGRILRAIREDEIFAQSLGKNTFKFKVIIFAVSAALASTAGSLYAHYIGYVDPSSFTVMESILIISMVVIGGADSLTGPLIGASILVLLPEMLLFLGLPSSAAANLRQIFYGGLLVVMMLLRPRGLVGRFGFGR